MDDVDAHQQSEKRWDEFHLKRDKQRGIIAALQQEEKHYQTKKREYRDPIKYPQAATIAQALQWLIERYMLNVQGVVRQTEVRSKWCVVTTQITFFFLFALQVGALVIYCVRLNDWVVYDIIMHQFGALVSIWKFFVHNLDEGCTVRAVSHNAVFVFGTFVVSVV